MSLVTSLSNYAGEQAQSKPQRILILIMLVVIFVLYSQRLFGIENTYYTTFVACFMVAVISIVILSTFLSVLAMTDNQHVKNFNNIFNSPGSKNFFAVIVLLLFVMFVYELPMYDSRQPHSILDRIMFGYNRYFSNKTIGLVLIFGFAITTAYFIHSTTREVGEGVKGAIVVTPAAVITPAAIGTTDVGTNK